MVWFICHHSTIPFSDRARALGIIPDAATTCALVMVGVHSLTGVSDINFDDFIDQLVAFFTIATMGFTYSVNLALFYLVQTTQL